MSTIQRIAKLRKHRQMRNRHATWCSITDAMVRPLAEESVVSLYRMASEDRIREIERGIRKGDVTIFGMPIRIDRFVAVG